MPKFEWDLNPALYTVPPFDVPFFGWNVGPLELRYYSLMFALVFIGGYYLLRWQIVRGGGRREDAEDFIVYGVLGVILGARFGHVIFYDWDQFVQDPVWLFKIWKGGLASHGATLGLIVAMWIFTWRRKIPFLEGADRFAFSAALGATLVRAGNFFNSEIVGRATDGTWGVYFPRHDGHTNVIYRHPSQLYEVALGLFVLLVLYVGDRAMGKEKRPRGALIALFFIVYFAGRFVVEFFKEYQTRAPDELLTMGQLLSIPAFLFGVGLLIWSFNKRLPARWPNVERVARADEPSAAKPKAKAKPHANASAKAEDEPPSVDADIDEEFDDAGLKKRRVTPTETE